MSDVVSELSIKVNAEASKANDAIDRLVDKLDRLTISLNKVQGTNLSGLANGVQKLGNAMQVMNTVKTADFTRLASNLAKLGNVNTQGLNISASSIITLSKAFNTIGGVSQNAIQVGDLAKSISKLGNKSVQNAVTNIPKLATALSGLMTTLSKSPKVSKNVIDLANSMANLASQGSKVGSASKSISNGLNRTTNAAQKASNGFKGLASYIGKFYATYFMAIRGIKKLWSSIEETADYIEAYNYFNVAIGKIGQDWGHLYEKYGYENAESYAESFNKRASESLSKLSGVQVAIDANGKGLLTESGIKNLGLNIQEITQYASQLASVTNSIGQTGEVSLAASSAFTKLAGDISSLFNVDYSSVANNLQSGLIGQSRALYKYGIDITNATLSTYAYNLGLSKSVSEMTQAEKMQLRMIAILDQSRVSWGDLANTIDSPSNMIRQFTNNLKEAGIILGQLFIPSLQKVMPIVNGVTIAIKRLLVSLAGIMGIKIEFDAFGSGYTGLSEDIDGVSDSLDDVAKSAKKANAGLRTFDELKVINTPNSSSSKTSGAGGGIDLTDEILKATEEYEKAWSDAYAKMESKAQAFADKIEKAFRPILTIFEDLFSGDFWKAGKDVSSLASSIFNYFSNAIHNVNWRQIGINIGDFLAGINWTDVLSSVGKFIWEAINGAMDLWSGTFAAAPIETTIITSIGLLHFSGLDKVLIQALSKPVLNGISGALASISGSSSIYAGIAGLFTTDIGLIFGAGTFAEIATTFVAGLGSAILAAWTGYNIGLSIREIEIGGKTVGEYVDDVVDNIVTTWLTGKAIIDEGIDELVVDWKTGWQIIFNTSTKIWSNVVTFFTKAFPQWWNSTVSPWFTLGKWLTLFSGAKNGLQNGWNSFSNWFQNTAIVKWWNTTKSYFLPSKWQFGGIKTGLTTAWNNAIDAVKDIWNRFANWLNSKLTWTIEPVIIGGKTLFGGTQINLGKVPTFATGGFPEDGWFRASQGEIMGQFDNGQSVVANNNQITTAISDAVQKGNQQMIAYMQQEIEELRTQNEFLQRIAAKEFGITENQIGESARNYAKNFKNRTGRPAYSF